MSEITLPALSVEEARQVERLMTEQLGIDPLQTMENAGRNLALVVKEMLAGDLADRPLVVLAGRGSHGGIGLVAARHLLNWGAWVQILCSEAADGYADAPARQLHTLQAMGAPLAWAEEGWELPPCDLVIDAIADIEANGEAQGKARDLIQLANSSIAPILSLEVPSGVDVERGLLLTPSIQAAATLALALPNRALLAEEVRRICGELYLGDTGVPPTLYEELGLEVEPFFVRDPIVRWDVINGVAQLINT
jgi:NAD(P)H-hydrate epimerase